MTNISHVQFLLLLGTEKGSSYQHESHIFILLSGLVRILHYKEESSKWVTVARVSRWGYNQHQGSDTSGWSRTSTSSCSNRKSKTMTGGDQLQDHHGRGSTPRPSREGINPKTSTGGDQPQDHHGRGSTKVGWRLKSSTFHTLNYLIWQWPSYTDPPIINTILTSEKIKHR